MEQLVPREEIERFRVLIEAALKNADPARKPSALHLGVDGSDFGESRWRLWGRIDEANRSLPTSTSLHGIHPTSSVALRIPRSDRYSTRTA